MCGDQHRSTLPHPRTRLLWRSFCAHKRLALHPCAISSKWHGRSRMKDKWVRIQDGRLGDLVERIAFNDARDMASLRQRRDTLVSWIISNVDLVFVSLVYAQPFMIVHAAVSLPPHNPLRALLLPRLRARYPHPSCPEKVEIAQVHALAPSFAEISVPRDWIAKRCTIIRR